MALPEDHYRIARHTAAVFGGNKPVLSRYWDAQEASLIDTVSSPNSPGNGTTAVGTIGLSDHPIGMTVDGKPLRVELVGACPSGLHLLPNMIATCAFFVINAHPPCSPGVVLTDVVAMYAPASDLKHILLVSPFSWARPFGILELPDCKVAWLQVIPVSEAECAFAGQNGSDALRTLFERRQADVFDLDRPSVL